MSYSLDYEIGTYHGEPGRGFHLPREVVTHKTTLIAETGKGKTYGGKVIVERALRDGQQVVVLDPVGVWWGLRAGADGKAKGGLPIIVIGGDHGDLPLEPGTAVEVADKVIEHRLSVIVDMSGFDTKSQQTTWVTEFAERLYRKNPRRAVLLVVDEADEFAPQKPMPNETKMLSVFQSIFKRGRAKGIGILALIQRPAAFSKDCLTQSSALIIMGIGAKDDLNAVMERVAVRVEDAQAKEIKREVPALQRGEGYFWSPGWLRITQRFQFNKITTFDSSATPEVGVEQAQPDAMAVVEALASIRAELEQASTGQAPASNGKPAAEKVIERVEVEVPILTREDREAVHDAAESARGACTYLEELRADLIGRLDMILEAYAQLAKDCEALEQRIAARETKPAPPGKLPPDIGKIPARVENFARDFEASVGKPGPKAGELPDRQQRIIDALAAINVARLPAQSRELVVAMAGYSPTNGDIGVALTELKQAGLIVYPTPGKLDITAAGLEHIGPNVPLLSLSRWHEVFLKRLKNARQREVATYLLETYPQEITREALAGVLKVSLTNGDFGTWISACIKLGIARKTERGSIAADPYMFPEALTRRQVAAR